jgi:hypothetical protein
MDHSLLYRLASNGVAAFPPDDLSALAELCGEHGEFTGDARYCSLQRTIEIVDLLFQEDGAVELRLVNRIDQMLGEQLPGVLNAAEAVDGAQAARRLRLEILSAISFAVVGR